MKFKKTIRASLTQKHKHEAEKRKYDEELMLKISDEISELKKKDQHNSNLSLKVIGEVGDLVRMLRDMEARIEKLERQNATKKVREGKSGGQG